jgi:hypothetical protein
MEHNFTILYDYMFNFFKGYFKAVPKCYILYNSFLGCNFELKFLVVN